MGLFHQTCIPGLRFDCIKYICVENQSFYTILVLILAFTGNMQTNVMCSSEVPGLPNSKMERTYQIVVIKRKYTNKIYIYMYIKKVFSKEKD